MLIAQNPYGNGMLGHPSYDILHDRPIRFQESARGENGPSEHDCDNYEGHEEERCEGDDDYSDRLSFDD